MLTRLSTSPSLSEHWVEHEGLFSSLATSWIASLYPPGKDLRLGCLPFSTSGSANLRVNGDFSVGGSKRFDWVRRRQRCFIGSIRRQSLFSSPAIRTSYRFLSDSGWHHLYYRRPDVRVDSAAGIPRNWNRIALSWSELPADFPAFRIKYEDVIGGRFDFRKLESWLGIEIREEVALSAVVGRTAIRHRIGWSERLIISHEATLGMRVLGYSEKV